MVVRFPDKPQYVDEKNEEELANIPKYEDIEKILKVAKRGKNPGELSNPRGIAIDENHIYVTEYYPARVSIFSVSGEFLDAFTHENMKQLWGIAIHCNNLFVSDTGVHGVFNFRISSEICLDSALVGKGSGDGEFNHPYQLTVSDKGEIFVADCFNHKIQILDESLRFQRSIKHDSMRYPINIKLTENEIFVQTDSSPCINVFTFAGEKIRSFITRGQGMEVTGPWFFCLDARMNLIFSDDGVDCVIIFSSTGALIHSIKGFKGGLFDHNTLGLALTRNFQIVVLAPTDSFVLYIFH